jgi:hypothetical protein
MKYEGEEQRRSALVASECHNFVQRPKAIVVDMDGTLCDVRSIRHIVASSRSARGRDFDAFHSASIDCPAHGEVVAIVNAAVERRLTILVVSARDERWSMLTALWLMEHSVPYDQMFLRKRGDQRSDVEVKNEIGFRAIRANFRCR